MTTTTPTPPSRRARRAAAGLRRDTQPTDIRQHHKAHKNRTGRSARTMAHSSRADEVTDVLLTVLTIAVGPLLLVSAAAILGVPVRVLISREAPGVIVQHLPQLDAGVRAVESALGLGAAGLGLLLSVGGLVAVAATCSLTLLERLGRAGQGPAHRALEVLAPRFMRRTLIVALSTQLVVLGSGAAVTISTTETAPMAPAAAAQTTPDRPLFTLSEAPVSEAPMFESPPPEAADEEPHLQPDDADAPDAKDPMTPLFTPQQPSVWPDRHAGAETRSTVDAHDEVTVRPGDTLWSIAADELGPQATDWEIAERWPDWYEANRAVIGTEPDHLLPGMILASPENG